MRHLNANTGSDVGEEGAMFLAEALRMKKTLFSWGLKTNSTLTSLDMSGKWKTEGHIIYVSMNWLNAESSVGLEGMMIINDMRKTNTVLKTLRFSGKRKLVGCYQLRVIL